MTCECCGQELDAFGDDAMDASEVTERAAQAGGKLKVLCPNCSHIQYREKVTLSAARETANG